MTKLLYLDDTYRCDANAAVEAISRDERGAYIVLDETIFYPQGGGQPADKGWIGLDERDVPVDFVGFVEGEVRHYVPEASLAGIACGMPAILKVDAANRLANARLHTGGHFISHVLETLDERLVPVKGYHFPDGSYVEFMNEHGVDGILLIEAANEQLASDVSARLPVIAAYSDFATIQELRPSLAPHIPREKPSRIVTIGEYRSLPCGGTHLSSLGEIGTIRITKTKNQKSNLKVSYQIA